MKKTRIVYVITSLLIICVIAINLTGCSNKVPTEDLMKGITPNEVEANEDLSLNNANVTNFAIRLFKECEISGENTLISPLSVLCALAMTANGAENETLKQMETVLGMTTEELNLYLYSYMNNLPQDDNYKLNLANSIWLNENNGFTANQDFLQTNSDYYGADIYKATFDKQTCADINNWVKEKTDEMIPKILDQIPRDAIMYLINALAFEAEWNEIYTEHNVKEGKFTKEDGTTQDAQFMHNKEIIYLEDEKATGFMKYYYGRKYAFVAMLPNKNISVSDYVDYLNGESLNTLLNNPKYITVNASIPKFETEYNINMTEILKNMGMTEAFEIQNADFNGFGSSANGNIFISRVLHKTFISVAEEGTKAGAATAVEMQEAEIESPETKEVYLDRPFVYMLVDCENNIPFFIGTMMNIEK